jgi:hypothetical protein
MLEHEKQAAKRNVAIGDSGFRAEPNTHILWGLIQHDKQAIQRVARF